MIRQLQPRHKQIRVDPTHDQPRAYDDCRLQRLLFAARMIVNSDGAKDPRLPALIQSLADATLELERTERTNDDRRIT